MSTQDTLDLTQANDSGVYFVDAADFDALIAAAEEGSLQVYRADLAHGRDKSDLLCRLARAFHASGDFEPNWEALRDTLRDLAGRHDSGQVLVFDHASDLRRAASKDFRSLLTLLHETVRFAMRQRRPFFAFLSLPEHPLALPSRRSA